MKDNIELLNEIQEEIFFLIYLISQNTSNTERGYEIKSYL